MKEAKEFTNTGEISRNFQPETAMIIVTCIGTEKIEIHGSDGRAHNK